MSVSIHMCVCMFVFVLDNIYKTRCYDCFIYNRLSVVTNNTSQTVYFASSITYWNHTKAPLTSEFVIYQLYLLLLKVVWRSPPWMVSMMPALNTTSCTHLAAVASPSVEQTTWNLCTTVETSWRVKLLNCYLRTCLTPMLMQKTRSLTPSILGLMIR